MNSHCISDLSALLIPLKKIRGTLEKLCGSIISVYFFPADLRVKRQQHGSEATPAAKSEGEVTTNSGENNGDR